MKVKLDDIEEAFMYVSAGNFCGDSAAYLYVKTGKIYYHSDYDVEELPDDIEDSDKYIAIPDKYELGLGHDLVYRFVDEYLPDYIDVVYRMFHSRGAYSRYKHFLLKHNMLDKWHEYEQQATQDALLSWCRDNDIEVDTAKN